MPSASPATIRPMRASRRSSMTSRRDCRAEAFRRAFVRPPRQLLFDARENLVREIEAEVLRREGQISSSWAAKLGNWCMRPWPGYLIAAAVLYLTYQFVGVFGAGTLVDYMENTLFAEYLVPAVAKLIDQALEGVPGPARPGEPIYLDNTCHPVNSRLALANAKRSKFNAFGIRWDDSSGTRNGHFAPFAWSG